MNSRQHHGHDGSPHRFVFQEPGELVNASMEEGISGDGVATFEWEGLTQYHVVVGAISSAASDLKKKWKD